MVDVGNSPSIIDRGCDDLEVCCDKVGDAIVARPFGAFLDVFRGGASLALAPYSSTNSMEFPNLVILRHSSYSGP